MKVLTAAATIFLPLTLISGIYGMNFEKNQFPELRRVVGFRGGRGVHDCHWPVSLLAFFRWRNWI